MQRVTSQYQVRKVSDTVLDHAVLAALTLSSSVIVNVFKNDKKSKSVMITF